MAASVSSLDQDMRKLRLDRYTPQASDEVRSWIDSTLGDALPSGDLLDALRDGVALCKFVEYSRTIHHHTDPSVQIGQPCPACPWYPFQSFHHALYPAREHLPVPPRLRDASPQPPRTRSFPHGRFV